MNVVKPNVDNNALLNVGLKIKINFRLMMLTFLENKTFF